MKKDKKTGESSAGIIIRYIIPYIVADLIVLWILTHVGFKGNEPYGKDAIPIIVFILLTINYFHFASRGKNKKRNSMK